MANFRRVRLALLIAFPFAAGSQPPSAVKLPDDYREWVFLSSGLGMTYGPQRAANTPEHPSFENVFVARAAYDGFRKTGTWPDNTMLILEIRGSATAESINKGGHFQKDIVAVEGEVKRNGVWTFYAFGKGTEGTAIPRDKDCYACHGASGAVDNTFVQFYPTLLPIAQAKGTVKSGH